MNKKIYAYVGNGKLGRLLGKLSNFVFLDCDITNMDSISLALNIFKARWGKFPDLLINCAGITSIDECEKLSTKELSLVNVRGLANLHSVFGSKVLCISSDHVFSGSYFLAPSEKTNPNPINNYGWSKFGAEQVSKICGGKVIRLSRTISAYDTDFIEYFSLLTNGVEISVPSFFWRNYLTRSQAVRGIQYFATNYDSMPQIVNYGGKSNVSMVTLFKELSKRMGLDSGKILARTQDLSMKTPRPHWGGYKVKLAEKLGFPMYSIQDICYEVLGELEQVELG